MGQPFGTIHGSQAMIVKSSIGSHSTYEKANLPAQDPATEKWANSWTSSNDRRSIPRATTEEFFYSLSVPPPSAWQSCQAPRDRQRQATEYNLPDSERKLYS